MEFFFGCYEIYFRLVNFGVARNIQIAKAFGRLIDLNLIKSKIIVTQIRVARGRILGVPLNDKFLK